MLLLTIGGLLSACVGIGLSFGVGPALMVGGAVCFVAGALNGRDRRAMRMPGRSPAAR